MKNLMEKAIVTIATVLIYYPAIGQAPFGPPPGGNTQPQTPDNFINQPSLNLQTEPGGIGGGGGGPCGDPIERTGNDIQTFEDGGNTFTARAMVWDGCPTFYFGVAGTPYANDYISAAAKLAKGATITDPDIILSQNTGNEVYVLIVYEKDGGIYLEQWNYNHANIIMTAPSSPNPPNENFIEISAEGVNPNIDGNNNDEVVVTYERNGEIITHVGTISSFTTLSKAINLTDCYGGGRFKTPDVSISDVGNFSSVVSYTCIQENFGNTELYVMQEEFPVLNALPTPTPISNCLQRNPLEIEETNKHPRISSPGANMINHKYECAISTEHVFQEQPSGLVTIYGIKLYDNHQYSGPLSPFDSRLLNYDPSVTNIVSYQPNSFPAITYAAPEKVSVAWTYENLEDGNNYKEDVISVNYNLSSNTRTPASYEYYMLVNQIRGENQYAPSVAGETNYGGSNYPVFYTFASMFTGGSQIVFKTSNTSLQPQIRKKNILTDGVNKVEEVLIYPNPTTQYVNIDFKGIDEKESIRIRIFSLDGRIVYDKTASTSEFSQPIDVTNFEKGIYLMEYEYGDVIEREKVIVQ